MLGAQEIREAFLTFDTDGSGEVDYHELKAAMRALGFAVKKKELLAILDDYDKDARSTVSAVEFHEICTTRRPAARCTPPTWRHRGRVGAWSVRDGVLACVDAKADGWSGRRLRIHHGCERGVRRAGRVCVCVYVYV